MGSEEESYIAGHRRFCSMSSWLWDPRDRAVFIWNISCLMVEGKVNIVNQMLLLNLSSYRENIPSHVSLPKESHMATSEPDRSGIPNLCRERKRF
jgi:hypothetical protein